MPCYHRHHSGEPRGVVVLCNKFKFGTIVGQLAGRTEAQVAGLQILLDSSKPGATRPTFGTFLAREMVTVDSRLCDCLGVGVVIKARNVTE